MLDKNISSFEAPLANAGQTRKRVEKTLENCEGWVVFGVEVNFEKQSVITIQKTILRSL